MQQNSAEKQAAAGKLRILQGSSGLARVPKYVLRYGISGVLLNAGGFAAYFGLIIVGFDPKAAFTISFVGQVLVGFIFNRDWTFRASVGFCDRFPQYAAAYIGAYVLNLAGLFLLVDILGYSAVIVQIVLTLLGAIGLFLVQRRLIFAGVCP